MHKVKSNHIALTKQQWVMAPPQKIYYCHFLHSDLFTIHNSAILMQICTEQYCCIRILPADLCNALRTLSVMHRARPDKGARAQCTMRSVHVAAARCIRTGSALSTQRWSAPTSACQACRACLLCIVPPGAACTLPKFSPTPFFFIRTFPLFCQKFFVPPSSPLIMITTIFWSKTLLNKTK